MQSLVQLETTARSLSDQAKYSEAVEVYRMLLSRQPNWEHGQGCYELAWHLEQLGQYDEAMEWYKRAIDQRPHYPYFWSAYASLATKCGDPMDALFYLFPALKYESANTATANKLCKLLALAASRAGKSRQLIEEIAVSYGFGPAVVAQIRDHWPADTVIAD